MPTVCTFNEACQILKIGKDKLRELMAAGEIKGYQSGNRWHIPEQELDEYVARKMGYCKDCPSAAGAAVR